ncbi:hypothetical protein FN846DRAFT_245672 [Sphaerosporella brunnea]|uniref:ATP synthase subunit K, mitochondrial n=1 Tax=Sphaerosporella brunnea TaxID=1250544 RepID=A0A5J5FB85_9PEZI|nr:hypothetical protein FN846DRAFT_245672 [Sphaerosporella brunnea]
MVAYFDIAGKKVGSHVLAMLTLGTTAGIAYLSMRGGDKKEKNLPPINAESGDEEKFIREFLANAEKEEKAGAKH